MASARAWFGMVFAVLLLVPWPAQAFGKKRPAPAEPPDTYAYPARQVWFDRLLETPFLLPDGKTRVDMSVVLPSLVLTEMKQAQTKLRPQEQAPGVPAEALGRYLIRGGITAFEATNFSHKIRIGYKPGVGDVGEGVLTGVEGELEFNVGTLEMSFYIVDRERNGEVVAVGRGNALPWGGSLGVKLNFGVIETGADFVYRSPMAPHFRKCVRDAFSQMVQDRQTNFLMDWGARVTAVNLDLKRVFFNAGARDEIKVNDVFIVYDNADMLLGEAKVRSVEHERAALEFKHDPNENLLRSARAGDSVRIRHPRVP